MAVYRSAQGRQVDMTHLAAKNEKIRAVGNMNVNARGDVIDSNNKIIKDNTKRVKTTYNNSVSSPRKPNQPVQRKVIAEPEVTELSTEEQAMFDDLDNEEDIKQ
jgi:hypothetical protein